MEEARNVLDPWGTTAISDYERLIKQFGIEPLTDDLIKRFPIQHRIIRRRIIFGHRDLNIILDAVEKGEVYAVMTGIKPSGPYHLGTKLTAEEIVLFQKLSPKAQVFYCIADIEAWNDNGIPPEQSYETAIDNVADLLAFGLDPHRVYVYRQSRELRVLSRAAIFARGLGINLLKAIYGERHMGLYLSALIQVADILLPQHEDFGGPKPTVVPVGIDQDPHIRFTRDLVDKYKRFYGYIRPAATYHRIQMSLTGQPKMSKRDPMGMFTLNEDLNSIRFKIMNAFTGGQPTVEEQRKYGGNPHKCAIYQMYLFHIDDDKLVEKVYNECINGQRLCGECKKQLYEIFSKWLMEHREKKEKLRDLAKQLVDQGTLH